MTRVIITHVGTSLFQSKALLNHFSKTKELLDNLRDDPTYEDPRSPQYPQDIAACQTALITGLTGCWGTSAAAKRRQCSPAEIASLSLMGVQPGDSLVLLHSDTPQGRFCAKILAHVLQQHIQPGSGYPFYDCRHGGVSVEQVQIDRLWVSDDLWQDLLAGSRDVFVREGCVNYVKALWKRYIKLKQGDQLIFNTTAGYKGMIPIARDLSLLLVAHSRSHGRPIVSTVSYLHETSSKLVKYGTLPIIFEWIPSLKRCLEQAPYPHGIDRTKLPELGTHPEWESFFEEAVDEQNQPTSRVCRSALGEVMHTLYQQMGPGHVTGR